MLRCDMPAVYRIESATFPLPWYEGDFLTALRKGAIGMVAELDGEIAGYMVYESYPSGFRIQNFAVDEKSRRRGVGSAMVNTLIKKLPQHRRQEVTLEVRESNLPMCHLLSSLEFKAVAVVAGYYADTDEDAYEFRYRLKAEEPVYHPRNRIAQHLGGES